MPECAYLILLAVLIGAGIVKRVPRVLMDEEEEDTPPAPVRRRRRRVKPKG